MSGNTSIILANPDYYSIRESLKQSFKEHPNFRDYNFDGSNLSVLLNVLATNTYQGAFMKNMLASEFFLGTAKLPASIYSRAKDHGYTPASCRSASTTLRIEIIPHDTPSTITIPRETVFTGSVGSRSLTFLTDKAYVLERSGQGTYIGDIEVYEGFYVNETFIAGPNKRYTISNKNVDISSLSLTVTDNNNTTSFLRQHNIINLTSKTAPVFYISMDYKNYYEVFFGDNVIGAQPPVGSTITMHYRVTSEELGNNAGVFRISGPIGGYSNINVTTTDLSTGGAKLENPEITRKYAPLANQIRGIALTDEDYIILLKQHFPEIRSINVFGGETLTPPQHGKVAISITTNDNFNGISNNLKTKYFNFIKSKNPTIITPTFVDPDLIKVKLNIRLSYDYTKTTLSESDITAKVIETLNTFNKLQLNDFKTTLRKSNLTSAIDSADSSINGNETKLELISIIDHTTISTRSKTVFLHNEILPSVIASSPSIFSTQFKFDNKLCRLVDQPDGNIYIETIQNGVASLLKPVGVVEYETGIITLSSFAIQELFTTNFKLYAKPKNEDIIAKLNAIVQLDFSELKVETIAQKR